MRMGFQGDIILKRAIQRTEGCLPPTVDCTLDELVARIPDMTAEQLNAYNQPDYSDEPIVSDHPIRVLGVTRDNQIAVHGVNYVGTRTLDELQEYISEARRGADRRRKYWAARVEHDLGKFICKPVTSYIM